MNTVKHSDFQSESVSQNLKFFSSFQVSSLCELGLLKKLKSINHKGAQALKNSPGGYFSAVARLQRWHIAQRSQSAEILIFTFVYFVPSLCTLWLKKTFSTAPDSRS
jgi:hypothetical protein